MIDKSRFVLFVDEQDYLSHIHKFEGNKFIIVVCTRRQPNKTTLLVVHVAQSKPERVLTRVAGFVLVAVPTFLPAATMSVVKSELKRIPLNSHLTLQVVRSCCRLPSLWQAGSSKKCRRAV